MALLGIKDKNFSRFGEKQKFTGLVNSGNPKQEKYEENHKQAHHSQISEPKISRKPWNQYTSVHLTQKKGNQNNRIIER